MVTKHKMALVVVMAALLCQTIAFAQDNQGTPEQKAACEALLRGESVPLDRLVPAWCRRSGLYLAA